MTERFQKAYDALVNAFFNDTLARGTCAACAVGNIVAAAKGGIVGRYPGSIRFNCTVNNSFWRDLFYTAFDGIQEITFRPRKHKYEISKPGTANSVQLCQELFDLTGYTADDLALVEYAFETNTEIYYNGYYHHTPQEILEDQYRGLCAVFEVLCWLDDITDSDYKEKMQYHTNLAVI